MTQSSRPPWWAARPVIAGDSRRRGVRRWSGVAGLGVAAERGLELLGVAAAADRERHGVARAVAADRRDQRFRACDRVVVDAGDHVARPEPGLVAGTVGLDLAD